MDNANQGVFPDVLDLAHLAEDAYTGCVGKNKVTRGRTWTCIATATYTDGYRGAAYKNENTANQHIVIAHGGTEFSVLHPIETFKDVSTDFSHVLLGGDSILGKAVKIFFTPVRIIKDKLSKASNNETKFDNKLPKASNNETQCDRIYCSQVTSALAFTQEIVDHFRGTVLSISVTGHSLGGWLAQICTLCIEYPSIVSQKQECVNNRKYELSLQFHESISLSAQDFSSQSFHLHTVVFESPGCKRTLAEIQEFKFQRYNRESRSEWEARMDSLDISVIISAANVISRADEHVGYLLCAKMTKTHSIAEMTKYLSLDSPQLFEVKEAHMWKEAELNEKAMILKNWYLGWSNKCRISVFNSRERKILLHAQILREWQRKDHLDNSEVDTFKNESNTAAILHELNEALRSATNRTDIILHISAGNPFMEFRTIDQAPIDWNGLGEKLVEHLLLKFRGNVGWNPDTLKHTIDSLPSCRQVFYHIEGSEYLKKIPRMHSCKSGSLCSKIRNFQQNEFKKVLKIRVPHGELFAKRLYLAHILHCFLGNETLFLNCEGVVKLNKILRMSNIFVNQPELKLIVLETNSLDDDGQASGIIEGILENMSSARQGQKLVIISDWGELVENVPKIRFDDLTIESKRFIISCPLNIQGETISIGITDLSSPYLLDEFDVKKCFNVGDYGSDMILRIFDGETVVVKDENLPQLPKHYINRKLFPIYLREEDLKEEIEKLGQIFVSCSSRFERTRIEKRLDFMKDKNLHFGKHSWKKSDFIEACRSIPATNAHWFRWNKSICRLEWQFSKSEPCMDFLCDEAGEIAEDDALKLENNIVILADEPGMGKSAAIINLYWKFRKHRKVRSQFIWPLYIDLNAFKLELKNRPDSDEEANLAFLARAININSAKTGASLALLKFCLKNEVSFALFIDSFDEISKAGQDFVSDMLVWLKEINPQIKIWIATRVFAKDELERKLKAKAHRFHRVGHDDQINYLTQCWTDAMLNYAIQEIQSVLGTNYTFIGIPQQLTLLALIHQESIIANVREKLNGKSDVAFSNAVKFESVHELYNLYVNVMTDSWLKKLPDMMDETENALRNKIDNVHCRAAFLYLSKSMFPDGSDISIERLTTMDCIEANRAGLFQIYRGSRVIHIPRKLYEQIAKPTCGSSHCHTTSDIIVLKLNISRPEDDSCKNLVNLLNELTTAKVEVIAAEDSDTEKYAKIHNCQLVHWFKEFENSNFYWHCSKSGSKDFPDYNDQCFEEVSELDMRPSHQTIAEFFTAKLLFTMIKNGFNDKATAVEFLKKNYYKPVFAKVRYFLDSFLCTGIPSLRNLEILDRKIGYLQEQFTLADWIKRDGLNRNVLHFAAAYGNYEQGIFWMIAKNPELLHEKDAMGVSCISYAVFARHSIISNVIRKTKRTLCSYLKLTQEADTTNELKSLQDLCSINGRVIDSFWFHFCFFGQLIPRESDLSSLRRRTNYNDESLNDHLSQKHFRIIDSDTNVKILLDIHRSDEEKLRILHAGLTVESSWVAGANDLRDKLTGFDFILSIYLHNHSYSLEEANGWLIEVYDNLFNRDPELAVLFLQRIGQLIFMYLHIRERDIDNILYGHVRTNIQSNYQTIFHFLNGNDEMYLWNGCTYKEKSIMMKIIVKHNFYSFFRIAVEGSETYFNDTHVSCLRDLTNFAKNSGMKDTIRKVLATVFELLVAMNARLSQVSFVWESLITKEGRKYSEGVWHANFKPKYPGTNPAVPKKCNWFSFFRFVLLGSDTWTNKYDSWIRKCTETITKEEALERFRNSDRFEQSPES